PRTTAPPVLAARHLAATLTARGNASVTHRHGRGISLVTIPVTRKEETNVWIEPGHVSYMARTGVRHRRPLVDLHDVAESLIRDVEMGPARR
ncbi:hypothetical protein, partial [Actinomadura sp. 7K507]|uniref:hypothetical protein n=1 Tax=Actinomadura sp. 7K507 TaxID=2530365 RepID=UPI00140461CB